MSGRDHPSPSSRPFYELPSNIKPCSKIIQETRAQLLSSSVSRSGNPWGDPQQYSSSLPMSSTISTTSIFHSRHLASGTDVQLSNTSSEIASSGDNAGIRPVHTQRPFTPRNADNFWGISARKRPPSAISLSLDDIDELRPLSSSRFKNLTGSNRQGSSSKFDARHSFDEEDIRIKESEFSRELIARTNAKLDVLSLREIPAGRCRSSDVRLRVADNQSSSSLSPLLNEKSRAKSASSSDQVNSFDSVLEYLDTTLKSSGPPPSKDDVIGILRRLKDKMGDVKSVEKVRSRLLKLIFRLVEKNQQDEDILFWSSFILLHCHIIGTNLTTVFKMVFKASRSKEYHDAVQEDLEYLDIFMDSFSQICPLTQTESMIYGYGTLKFVCGEGAILLHVLNRNLVPVMTLHLKILNYEAVRLKRVPDSILNGVFQLTSILRSIVGIDSSLSSISQSGLLEEICNSLVWTLEDIDVLSNIVRILSVVSGNDECCQVLSSTDSINPAFIRILQVWHSKEDIVVRLTYCLGNLLAKSENMRIKLYNEELAFQIITQLIGYYMESESQAADDILVKSIRILANWSLNGSIGAELSEEDQLNTMLNAIIADSTADNISNELLLCAMSTLNNISYYKDQNSLTSTNIQTADYLFAYLTVPSLEVRTEAMKVLGNLSRNLTVRQRCSQNVRDILVSLQDDSPDLLCATIGVLMNIIVEEVVKLEFRANEGLDALLNLMERNEDCGTNLMICQLLWNLVVSVTSIDENGQEYSRSEVLARKEIARLKQLLKKRLNVIDEGGMGAGDNVIDDGIISDFTSVAQNLYEKLNSLSTSV